MESKLTQLLDAYETGKISRKSFIATLGALLLTPAMGSSRQGFLAKSLNHVTLAVTDVERSKKFYEDILGASVVSTQKNGVNMGLGDSFLGLYNIDSPPRIHHFCVGLDRFNVDESANKLRSLGLDPYVRKDKPEVYFTDPDGITVQLENKRYRG